MFCPIRHAIGYWRDESKAERTSATARIVTTSSGAGLRGSIAQSNYVAAKAGIAAFTINAAAELGRYGVLANTIAPSARSRMTEQGMPEMMKKPETGFDVDGPGQRVAVRRVVGERRLRRHRARVRDGGRRRVRDERLDRGPSVDEGRRLAPAEVGGVLRGLIADAPVPEAVHGT